MDAVKEHIVKFYAYHGIEVTRSNSETCVASLPPQFRDLSAFTADLWCEFGVVVDIAMAHGTIEATIRFDNAAKQKETSGASLIMVLIILVASVLLGVLYLPKGQELVAKGNLV